MPLWPCATRQPEAVVTRTATGHQSRRGHMTVATRCHLPPGRTAQINMRNNRHWRGREETGASCTAGGTRVRPRWQTVRSSVHSQKENWPATQPLRRCAARRHTTRIRDDVKPPCVPQPRRKHTRVRRQVETCHTHDGGLGRQQGGALATRRGVRGPRCRAKQNQSVRDRQTPSELTRFGV